MGGWEKNEENQLLASEEGKKQGNAFVQETLKLETTVCGLQFSVVFTFSQALHLYAPLIFRL